MTVSRAKACLLLGLLAVLGGPATAQVVMPSAATPAVPAPDTGRDASFVPPDSYTPATAAPVVITAPTPAPVLTATPPAIVAPPAAIALPSAAPATPTVMPAVATPATTPALIAKPVEAASIGTIDPQSIGLLAKAEGGLGADIWKGTSLALVAKLFPTLNLPTASKTLNNLAQRLLLTTASVPEGVSDSNQSLTSMRIEKLLTLGDAQDAWKLAMLAKSDQIDEITLRLMAEAALISPARDDVCAKLPDIVKVHSGAEWQKLLLVCQLRATDTKAAQLTLDLLHAQGVKDDIYFAVAEKNIIGGNKQLPRQLTPLKPLTLALLRLTDLPLPGEIYMHPDATLIPELLQAKAREDVARLGLAERAAERGMINAADLVTLYRGVTFTPDALANAANSPESGPRLHAMLYQAALQDKSPQNRIIDAAKFMQSISPALLNSVGGSIMDDMLGDIPQTSEFNSTSGFIAHIYVLADKHEAAIDWLKLAKRAGIGIPSVTAELYNFWPVTVFAGLESDTDYMADLSKWLDGFLKNADPKLDARTRRDQAASILLLLESDGFNVPEEAWIKVIDPPGNEKRIMPSAVFLERLRSASTTPRHGETVMLCLALAGNAADIPILTYMQSIRALRLSGFTADAAMLAREDATNILASPKP